MQFPEDDLSRFLYRYSEEERCQIYQNVVIRNRYHYFYKHHIWLFRSPENHNSLVYTKVNPRYQVFPFGWIDQRGMDDLFYIHLI